MANAGATGKPRLVIIIASTRPGRAGLPIGQWFAERARAFGGFEIDVADLAEIALPMMDEPNHPRLQQYTHDHTKAWSARIEAAEAIALVMPEYNHGYTAPLKNAIDYLVAEWAFKPVGLVSYGGISGGLRAVQSLKPVLSGLRMIPLTESITIQQFNRFMTDDDRFVPDDTLEQAADTMLAELLRWNLALRPLREDA